MFWYKSRVGQIETSKKKSGIVSFFGIVSKNLLNVYVYEPFPGARGVITTRKAWPLPHTDTQLQGHRLWHICWRKNTDLGVGL